MTLISEWIQNLLLFIIFAAVLDMLLPSASLGKYVQFVIGLLLFVLLLTPLFEIFRMPVEETLETLIFPAVNQENEQSRLEEKKIEIQARQRAYILEQMAVQLKNTLNPTLKERFQAEMVSGEFDAEVSEQNRLEKIHGLKVVIQADAQTVHEVAVIESVQIGDADPKTDEGQAEKLAAIRDFFAEQLNLDAEKIEVIQKGEES